MRTLVQDMLIIIQSTYQLQHLRIPFLITITITIILLLGIAVVAIVVVGVEDGD